MTDSANLTTGMVMRISYVVVRNPAPRLLPRFIRRALGECYLAIEDNRPVFTPEWHAARVFPSHEWADTYVRDRDGRVRPYATGAVVIRSTFRRHNIP